MGKSWKEKVAGKLARMPVGREVRERRFELTSTLWPGSHATAYQRVWDGSAWQTIEAPLAEFRVYDDLSLHFGRGRNAFASPHDAGSKGVARWDGETDRWVIVAMEEYAQWISGSVTYDFLCSYTSFQIHGINIILPYRGIVVDQNPAEPMTIYNPFWLAGNTMTGLSFTRVDARWNGFRGVWEGIHILEVCTY